MSESLDVERAGAMLAALLARSGSALLLRDPSGRTAPVLPETAGAPDGLLPVFMVAADAVWREATGKEFGVEVAPDPAALLGYRVHGVRGGTFSAVMLSVMEATSQVTGPEVVLVNDLGALWNAATQRTERKQQPAPRPSTGAAP